MGSLSTAPLIMFSLSGVRCMLQMFWCSSIGMFSFCDGNQLRGSVKTISFPGLYELYSHTSVVVIAFFVDVGCCMDGFLLYHFEWFVIVVCCDVSAIYICVKFSNLKQTDRHLCSILAYLVSMLVRVLEAKAIGLPSWMRAVPRPYSLALVCITMGLVP